MFNPMFGNKVGRKSLLTFSFVLLLAMGYLTMDFNSSLFSSGPSGAVTQDVTSLPTKIGIIIGVVISIILISFIIWWIKKRGISKRDEKDF